MGLETVQLAASLSFARVPISVGINPIARCSVGFGPPLEPAEIVEIPTETTVIGLGSKKHVIEIGSKNLTANRGQAEAKFRLTFERMQTYQNETLTLQNVQLTVDIEGLASGASSVFWFKSREDLSLQRSLVRTDCVQSSDGGFVYGYALVGQPMLPLDSIQ